MNGNVDSVNSRFSMIFYGFPISSTWNAQDVTLRYTIDIEKEVDKLIEDPSCPQLHQGQLCTCHGLKVEVVEIELV